ncbi:hypothetical protein AALP_AA5G265700 [Arabis alpina]|uniref:Uncharacterized protein n=1 Tax=Arabis alpina TaxID=50452 RepID=A0A087GZJ0_ARAAL|nr:hypothetical protein AALP_AA5G265700 [Arabis alpina]
MKWGWREEDWWFQNPKLVMAISLMLVTWDMDSGIIKTLKIEDRKESKNYTKMQYSQRTFDFYLADQETQETGKNQLS